MSKIKGILILLFILLLGCGIKTRFDNKDLIWLNPYEKGETIIFESNTGIYDTIYILDKDIYYDKYNPVETHDKYNPQIGIIYYKSKYTDFNWQPKGDILIEMHKRSPNLPADFIFDFLNSWIGVKEYSSISKLEITLSNKQAIMVYELNTYNKEKHPNAPTKVYWHEKFGVIKYQTYDNVIWERINF